MARRHPRVAVGLCIARESIVLLLPRACDSAPNWNGMFFRSIARDVAIFHRWHFNVQIDPIEEGTRDSLAVTLHLQRTAATFAFQVSEISTRAGVHRRNEHEFARKSQAARGPGDRHFYVLQRLPHHFERRTFEFGKLIEKKNAVVRETDLAGRGKCATS